MKLSVCLVLMEINCNDERLVRGGGGGGGGRGGELTSYIEVEYSILFEYMQ
jgi:hypothetical protein